jgi:hypothetical protein
MPKRDSGQKPDDSEELDPALEGFLQSMDFTTAPGSKENWLVVFLDILTYALFRGFPFCALRAEADTSVRFAGNWRSLPPMI